MSKNLIVGLVILLTLFFSGKWRGIFKLQRKEKIYLLFIGVIGGSLPFYLFFTGISMIPAVNAAMIHKTLVIWVALLAGPFLKERLSRKQGAAILLVFAGNLLLGGFEGLQFALGELLVLAATILWAIENIIAKKVLPRVNVDLVTAVRMGFGALLLLVSALVIQPQELGSLFSLNFNQWFLLILTALFLLVYVSSWYRALKFAPAVTVTTVLTGSTLITNVLSALFITHVWKLIFLPQAGLIIFGLALYFFSSLRESKVSFVQ
jgi:drug/metabolite transporter (DMT)-like permease